MKNLNNGDTNLVIRTTINDNFNTIEARINALAQQLGGQSGGTLTAVLTFNQPNSMSVGDADQILNATSTNVSSPIVFTSSDPTIATIINGKLHPITPGTITITASQSAGNGYTAAQPVTKPVQVLAVNAPVAPKIDLIGLTSSSVSLKFDTTDAGGSFTLLRGLTPNVNQAIEVYHGTANSKEDTGLVAESPYYYFLKYTKNGISSAYTSRRYYTDFAENRKFKPFQNGTYGFGDSITQGAGVQKSWFVRVGEQLSVNVINRANSGYTTNAETRVAMTSLPMVSEIPTAVQLGTNNFKGSTDFSRTLEDILAGHRAIAASHFAKTTIFGNQMTPSRTDHGNQSNDYLQQLGSRAVVERSRTGGDRNASWYYNNTNQQAGDFLSFNFTGTGLALHAFMAGSDQYRSSSIKVEVDNQEIATWNMSIGMDFDGSPDAFILTGFENVTHSAKLTFLENRTHALDCVDVLKSVAEAQQAPLYINDIPHFATQGLTYDTFGSNTFQLTNALFDQASAARKLHLQKLLPGYPIAFVPINNYYNAADTSQIQSDGVHPTDAGNINIQAAAITKMDLTGIGTTPGYNDLFETKKHIQLNGNTYTSTGDASFGFGNTGDSTANFLQAGQDGYLEFDINDDTNKVAVVGFRTGTSGGWQSYNAGVYIPDSSPRSANTIDAGTAGWAPVTFPTGTIKLRIGRAAGIFTAYFVLSDNSLVPIGNLTNGHTNDKVYIGLDVLAPSGKISNLVFVKQ